VVLGVESYCTRRSVGSPSAFGFAAFR